MDSEKLRALVVETLFFMLIIFAGLLFYSGFNPNFRPGFQTRMLVAMLLLACLALAAHFWPTVKITLKKSLGKGGEYPTAEPELPVHGVPLRQLLAAVRDPKNLVAGALYAVHLLWSALDAASKNTRIISVATAALSGAAAYNRFSFPFPFSAALFLGVFLIVSIASGSYENEKNDELVARF